MLDIMLCPVPASIILAFGLGAAFAQGAVCPGGSIRLDLSFAATPHVHMRLGNRQGVFLIDTGASASSVDALTFGLEPGSRTYFEGSSFPTIAGGEFAVSNLGKMRAPGGGLAGVLGTDFLSLRIAEFHYDVPAPYLVLSRRRCSARQFENAGFFPISQDKYYSADTTRLGPGISNIPVIFVRIGAVIAPAQIDSGYSERGGVRGVVQVNDILFRELRNTGISIHPADPIEEVAITDCRGKRSTPAMWRVQGTPLQMTTHHGETVFKYDPPLLQVKPNSSACGGIGSAVEAMAEIGATYLERWGAFALDPFNERLWVRKAW